MADIAGDVITAEPNRIRVGTERLAAEVRQAVGDRIPVEVCATPELDTMATALAASLGEGEERRYLEGDDVDEALVGAFFASAESFAQLEPWRVAAEEDALRLDLPELDVHGAVVSVVGASVESRGFILFADLDRYFDFMGGEGTSTPRHSWHRTHSAPACLNVSREGPR